MRARAKETGASTYAALVFCFHRALLGIDAFRTALAATTWCCTTASTSHDGAGAERTFSFANFGWTPMPRASSPPPASDGGGLTRADLTGGKNPDYAYYTALAAGALHQLRPRGASDPTAVQPRPPSASSARARTRRGAGRHTGQPPLRRRRRPRRPLRSGARELRPRVLSDPAMKLRVGVLEILTDAVDTDWLERNYDRRFRRYYASIMPQAVSAWCRQLGHDVTYATYWGRRRPRTCCRPSSTRPSSHTNPRARSPTPSRVLYRRRGVRTVSAVRTPPPSPPTASLLRPRRPRLRQGADRRPPAREHAPGSV